jgi:hypothetical protein
LCRTTEQVYRTGTVQNSTVSSRVEGWPAAKRSQILALTFSNDEKRLTFVSTRARGRILFISSLCYNLCAVLFCSLEHRLCVITMTSRAENARKRKQTWTFQDGLVSSDDGQINSKARRVSTDASALATASLQVDTPVASEEVTAANAASAVTEDEGLNQSIGKMIQDLAHSNNAKVKAALVALDLDFMADKKKRESFVTAGGCFVLVQLLKKCLDKAIDGIPACGRVTEVNEFAKLKTLRKAFNVITNLTFEHDESKVGISTIGGVEAVVKVMKTFPKCQALQERACRVLINLACCGIGKKQAIESGGIQVILAAIHNHLDSANVCESACWTLKNIVSGSKENTGLLINLGGGAAVAKVKTKWPDNDDVQTQVRKLVKIIAAEWKAWDDEE